MLLRFTSKMYYLPLTAFFADVLRWIFCSPPLFTHGEFLVGRMGQMLGVHPTMTSQKPHSAWLSRVSSRSEGNIKQGFTKTGSRKKRSVLAIVRGTRVCTFANISPTRVIFIFHKRRALASVEEG